LCSRNTLRHKLLMSAKIIDYEQARGLMSKGVVSFWQRAELQAIDRKILRKLSVYNGDATSIPEPYATMIKVRGFSSTDMQMAAQIVHQAESRSVSHCRPEDYIKTAGGHNHYLPGKVELVTPAGARKERMNSPIPAAFGEVERYSNVVALTSLCGQLVTNASGKWKTSVNLDAWMKTFGETAIKVTNVPRIVEKVIDIMEKDIVWTSMTPTNRSGVTGNARLCFMRSALDRLGEASYLVLNTSIVCDLFNTFQLQNGKWYRVQDDAGNPFVANSMFEKVEATQELYDILGEYYPGCFKYLGGTLVAPTVPTTDGTLETTVKVVQRLREVQGSSDSVAVILSGMRDYSGLTDDFGKRIQFQLAATLSIWSLGKTADIQLESIGDLAIMISSLNYWKRQIKESKIEGFYTEEKKGDVFVTTRPECGFKFLLPGTMDFAKVQQPNLRSELISVPRSDSVIVLYSSAGMPTSAEKGKRLDYDKESESLLPPSFRDKNFIANCTIYGAIPFAQDKAVLKRMQSSIQVLTYYEKPVFVYAFSTASDFRGVFSTIPDLQLVGFGFPFMPQTTSRVPLRDLTQEKLHLFSLKRVVTQMEWYTLVTVDACKQMVSWLAPVSRYSPISNLPRMSKMAATLSRQIVESEAGELIANIPMPLASKVKPVGEVFNGWSSIKKASASVDSFLSLPPSSSATVYSSTDMSLSKSSSTLSTVKQDDDEGDDELEEKPGAVFSADDL